MSSIHNKSFSKSTKQSWKKITNHRSIDFPLWSVRLECALGVSRDSISAPVLCEETDTGTGLVNPFPAHKSTPGQWQCKCSLHVMHRTLLHLNWGQIRVEIRAEHVNTKLSTYHAYTSINYLTYISPPPLSPTHSHLELTVDDRYVMFMNWLGCMYVGVTSMYAPIKISVSWMVKWAIEQCFWKVVDFHGNRQTSVSCVG